MIKRLAAVALALGVFLGAGFMAPRPVSAGTLVPCKMLVFHTFLWWSWTTVENGFCDITNFV